MGQTERQTRPKTRRRKASLLRAICLSTRIGNRDPSESLQPVHFHLITNKKYRIMPISQNGSAVFKFVRRVIANAAQIANEPDKNLCKISSAVQATA
jgi:hypothetical protein